MRWSRASLFAAVALACITFALDSTASEDVEPIHFEYRAIADCPLESDMVRRISSYTKRWTHAAPDEDARRFALRIDRRSETFVGRVAITTRKRNDGTTIVREIEGADCEHVATGLAVVVATAIDPVAILVPTVVDVPAPGASIDAPAPSPTPSDGEEAFASTARPGEVVPAERPPARKAGQRAPAGAPFSLSVGGRVELTGALSSTLPVLAAFGELAWPPASRLPWLALTVRLGLRQSLPRTTQLDAEDISILWSAGFVEVCPAHLLLGARASMTACLTANAGVVSAKARDVPEGATAFRAWFDYGAAGGMRWWLHPNVFVEVGGGLVVPVTRDRFRAAPDGPAMIAPRVGGAGSAGGGWRF